uniref:Uncharacterized protein n=1 Tax=Aureoumbra lagunensis TaxID=44058 RepID=A0A6S8DZZ9_9STRA|mmetsp:Transcript_1844/g.2460  ORF Transcript_1844/g.2460 Transcript_1844/m.2460 type:complete len:389 (+) Transcript_1844:359-1525(+)
MLRLSFLLPIALCGSTERDVTPYPSCWKVLRSCRLDKYHNCKGEEYSKHLKDIGCPPVLKSPLIPANARVLAYGTSYMRQLYREIACLHHAQRFVVDIETQAQHSLSRFMTLRLTNNATITSLSNLKEYQRSTNLQELANLIQAFGFTHALFMESHPDCFFDGKRCVPIGNTTAVADRAASFSEVLQQCQLRSIFTTFFSPMNWIHVRPWSGLYAIRQNSTQNLDACQTPLFFSSSTSHQTAERSSRTSFTAHTPSQHHNQHHEIHNLVSSSKLHHVNTIDLQAVFNKRRPCLTPSCKNDIGGHQCASGDITFAAFGILRRLFPNNYVLASSFLKRGGDSNALIHDHLLKETEHIKQEKKNFTVPPEFTHSNSKKRKSIVHQILGGGD